MGPTSATPLPLHATRYRSRQCLSLLLSLPCRASLTRQASQHCRYPRSHPDEHAGAVPGHAAAPAAACPRLLGAGLLVSGTAPAGPAVGCSAPAAAHPPHSGSTTWGCLGSSRLRLPLRLGTSTGRRRQRCLAVCHQGLPHRSLRQQSSRLPLARRSHRRRHCCRCCRCRWRRAGWHCSAQNVGRDRLGQACGHRHSMHSTTSRWNK